MWRHLNVPSSEQERGRVVDRGVVLRPRRVAGELRPREGERRVRGVKRPVGEQMPVEPSGEPASIPVAHFIAHRDHAAHTCSKQLEGRPREPVAPLEQYVQRGSRAASFAAASLSRFERGQ